MIMPETIIKPASQSPAIAKRHFHMFDTLRFFAFLKVFLQHVPVFAFAWFNFLRAGGMIGVQFFFVLSGFLITYIIYNEKSQTGTYNLKNFFVRRILRIWPLFYLLIGVSYSIPWILNTLHQPKVINGYQPTWWVSILFLENYKMIFTHSLPNVPELAVTWSLCIEEHFYIIWGLILWFFPIKAFPKISISCIIIALIARIIFFHYHLDPTDLFTNIDLFAFGGISAYLLVFYDRQTEKLVGRIPRSVHIIFLIFVIFFVLLTAQVRNVIATNIWLPSVSGITFSMLIFFSMHDNNYLRPSAILNKAGTYTYGLYMYHILIIVFLVRIFNYLNLSLDNPINALIFTALALASTFTCSIVSYHFFEKPFLKLKHFFK
ncbi:MAG: acyltransferase family protein [Chitinophagales bacterium]